MTGDRLSRILLALVLVGGARPAAAQHDSALAMGATIRAISCAVPPRRADERTEGLLVAFDTSRITLVGETLAELPLRRTLSIERQTRQSHRLIGAAIGAPLGYILGGILGRPSENQLRASDGLAQIGVALGQFVGTFVGGGIGAAVAGPRWSQVPLPAGAGADCEFRDQSPTSRATGVIPLPPASPATEASPQADARRRTAFRSTISPPR